MTTITSDLLWNKLVSMLTADQRREFIGFIATLIEPKRRGRKPGSKNKPKTTVISNTTVEKRRQRRAA